jgi:hypothetical protein
MNIQGIRPAHSIFHRASLFRGRPPPKTLTPGDNLVIDGILPISMAKNF